MRLLILVVALCVQAAHAQSRIDCDQIESQILHEAVHYCVMLPPGYSAAVANHPPRQYPVLYYLHGLGDNEQTLFKSGGWNQLQDLQQQHKIADFLIVAPEGKASFYINSADQQVLYSDFFLREFMPFVENKYNIRKDRKSRAISGVSMGGYGALRFAFAHPALFGSVSAQSPALVARSTSPGNSFGRFLGSVFGNPIDLPHWRQNDPSVLAQKNLARLRGLAIYFNCGRSDDYGFEKAAEALHRQLLREAIKHEYHLYPGSHGAEYFLSHIGETMEFHSRVFQTAKSSTHPGKNLPEIGGRRRFCSTRHSWPDGHGFTLILKPHQERRLFRSRKALLVEPVVVGAHVRIDQRSGCIELNPVAGS
jgi:S-formylglutathione hydrolase FrmB